MCKGRQMTETVWLSVVRAWGMPVSQISVEAATRLGIAAQPNEWCQVRLCSETGRQEEGFLAKVASTLEDTMMTWPREKEFRRPDVMIGTRDRGLLERFLHDRWMDPELEETLRPGAVCRWHIRIVLWEGERWYLNLLVSETSQRSRITSEAAAKLGRESKEDGCMHLKDMNGMDVPISVDMVDTTEELVAGEILPPCKNKPHMLLTMKDALRIWEMMLTGWRGESDLRKGWASQGVKKDQVPQGIQGGEAGEQMRVKHLQVRVRDSMARITVLFDKNVPNTVIRYGAAEMLGLKVGRAWYQVPLLNTEGYIRRGHAGCGRTVRGTSSDLLDMEKGTRRVTWEWERADMVIGRDNMDCKPEHICGWPREGFPLEIMGPLGFYTRKDLGELNRRN